MGGHCHIIVVSKRTSEQRLKLNDDDDKI